MVLKGVEWKGTPSRGWTLALALTEFCLRRLAVQNLARTRPELRLLPAAAATAARPQRPACAPRLSCCCIHKRRGAGRAPAAAAAAAAAAVDDDDDDDCGDDAAAAADGVAGGLAVRGPRHGCAAAVRGLPDQRVRLGRGLSGAAAMAVARAAGPLAQRYSDCFTDHGL